MRLAVIPARSGSKGVHDKNIRNLAGTPLLAHTVEAALLSGVFDRVMVSTDSERYAEIARSWGAEVPFMRSKGLAGDEVSSWDVVREVVHLYYELMGEKVDHIALLQPTSPLRNGVDIAGAFTLLTEKSAHSVVSVCECDHSPLWAAKLGDDLSMAGFAVSAKGLIRRQDLPVFYRINGAIYILDSYALQNAEELYSCGCYAYVMPQERSIDIDTELDFRIAECLISYTAK